MIANKKIYPIHDMKDFVNTLVTQLSLEKKQSKSLFKKDQLKDISTHQKKLLNFIRNNGPVLLEKISIDTKTDISAILQEISFLEIY